MPSMSPVLSPAQTGVSVHDCEASTSLVLSPSVGSSSSSSACKELELYLSGDSETRRGASVSWLLVGVVLHCPSHSSVH